MIARHGTIQILAVAAVLAATTASRGADPKIYRILPTGGRRGTQFAVKISGARLGDACDLFLYEPGITLKGVHAGTSSQVTAQLAIAPDAPLGPHALRVRTATGISNLLTFSVGALREIEEAEPNNDFEHAQSIPLDVTVNGVVENEDLDYFVVAAKKGQRLTAEIEGLRLGLDFFDPHLAILNAKHFVLAAADDTPAVWQDAVCSIVVPEDGKYYIEVRESAFRGSDRCRYRLHVGQFPRPLAVYPAGGMPGERLAVRWLGDVGGAWSETISLPATPLLDYRRTARDSRGECPWPLPLRLVQLKNVLEQEPNDTPGQATLFSAPAALNGVLQRPGDVDYFKFHARRQAVYDVRVYARALRTPVDSVLTIERSTGRVVAANDDSGSPDSYLRFTAPADDDYLLRISDHLGHGGAEYVYRVEVTPVEPHLTLGLTEREQFVDITPSVPQGSRTAAMVNVEREDFGGKVELRFNHLPAGVRADALPIGENDTAVPVIFSAAADAPLAGALVEAVGRATVDGKTVEGGLRQRTSLVRGRNNHEMWNYTGQRMALAVTKAAPFDVEIVPPKAPLVQNGSRGLTVRVRRRGGFDGPVTVSMLYNPPGISSIHAATIGKGETQTQIPLTADGSARVGISPITVLGTATVGDGPVTLAAPLVNLTVSEPFFRVVFSPLSVEQGKTGELALRIEKLKDFPGPVKAELVGLPGGVTAPPRKFAADAKEIVFPLATTANSPPGRHKTIYCKAVVTIAGEAVTLTQGGSDLRIQRPLPVKVAQLGSPKAAAAATKETARLDRLDQLRQARQAAKP